MKRFAEGDLHAVVASSAATMHRALRFAATAAGKSTIVMPRSAPIAKVSATQGYGAEVVLAGNIYDEARVPRRARSARDRRRVHPPV